MQTAKLFKDSAIHFKAISRNGSQWLARNRALVNSWAADRGICQEELARCIVADTSEVVESVNLSEAVTVLITCCDYEQYLFDCLDSVARSTLLPMIVYVIDDGSKTAISSGKWCAKFKDRLNLRIVRVEFKNVHKARAYGLEFVTTKYVQILDADNMLRPEFMADAVKRMEADRNAAFVFPVLEIMDGGPGGRFVPVTTRTGATVVAGDIETVNACDASSLFRTEVLRQSLVMFVDIGAGCFAHDWRVARNVLRLGGFHALKSEIALRYRVHEKQMSKTGWPVSYYVDADLCNEVVTIVVAFSGRWKQWAKLRDWILAQDWPRKQTRLLIMNGTHDDLTVSELGLQWEPFCSIQVERFDAGSPALANRERRSQVATGKQVECAVASIYNRAVAMLGGFEYVFFLEDDVIPKRPDTIECLLRGMSADVAAVSGRYRHRYELMACAYTAPNSDKAAPLISMEGAEVETVRGTGFGCLLVRRSVLALFPLSGDSKSVPHYDVHFAERVFASGLKWLLLRSVDCDHLT